MRKCKRGFTLVEVSLFLAITGLLFVGIALGIQNSMVQQRFNDSVQSFAEFLRSVYSQVANVQNPVGDGRSRTAVYGRLVVFGESKTLDGQNNDNKEIYTYDVVGNVSDEVLSSNTLSALVSLDVNVKDSAGNYYGNVESYTPRWQAGIQTTANSMTVFSGALLMVRNPRSGTIFTFIKDNGTLEVNGNNSFSLVDAIKANSFKAFSAKEVNFCVNPNGNNKSSTRRNIRIVKNARNASGVEVIGLDDDGAEGNKCE